MTKTNDEFVEILLARREIDARCAREQWLAERTAEEQRKALQARCTGLGHLEAANSKLRGVYECAACGQLLRDLLLDGVIAAANRRLEADPPSGATRGHRGHAAHPALDTARAISLEPQQGLTGPSAAETV